MPVYLSSLRFLAASMFSGRSHGQVTLIRKAFLLFIVEDDNVGLQQSGEIPDCMAEELRSQGIRDGIERSNSLAHFLCTRVDLNA